MVSLSSLNEVPHLTIQATAKDAEAFGSGIDRVVATTVSAKDAPPLCHDWVGLSCTKDLLECKGRHYYISIGERNKWVAKRERREKALDMQALSSVLRREALLEILHAAASKAKKSYLEGPSNDEAQLSACNEEQEIITSLTRNGSSQSAQCRQRNADESASVVIAPVLTLLDQLRVSGVECVENLAAWREYYTLQRRIVADGGKLRSGKEGRVWIATIESDGRQLWGPIPAVYSQFNKYQRGILPAKRARVTKFLGVFATRGAAIQAYEAAKPRVAMERRVLLNKLPPRAERESFGGISVVETRGSKSLPKLEHAIRSRVKADDPPPPAYFYDGENYLVKMAVDLDWLETLVPLRVCVSVDFPLKHNPFMLTSSLKEAIKRNEFLGRLLSYSAMQCPRNSLPVPIKRGSSDADRIGSVLLMSRIQGGCEIQESSGKSTKSCVPYTSDGEFGNPTELVTRHIQGALISWKGKINLGSRFEGPSNDNKDCVDVLDMVRVSRAVAIIEEEARANKWNSEVSKDQDKESFENSDDASDSGDDDSDAQTSTGHVERQIWAQYEELQATLIVQQPRNLLKGILKGVFCRAERGKWKGIGMPGPATRTYWFKRQLREDGERRKVRRDLVAARLRKETSRGLVRMRPGKMICLLRQATELRGAGRIAVDAHRAKLLLEWRYSAEICAKILERYIRGIRGRRSVKKHRRVLGLAFDVRYHRRDLCLRAAKAVVDFATKAALSRIAHKLTAPAHVAAGYLDGDRCFFLVYSLNHREQTMTSAKRGQNLHSSIVNDDIGGFLALNKALTPVLSRDPATGNLRQDHAPHINIYLEEAVQHRCWPRIPETLLVAGYNPATQQTRAVDVDESEFRKRLIEAEAATVGGAVLLYQDHIMRNEIIRLLRLKPVAQTDVLLGYGCQQRDRWEPIREENYFKEKLHTARRSQHVHRIAWTNAVAAAATSIDQFEASRLRVEAAGMAYEEALMRRHSCRPPFKAAAVST